MGLSSSQPIGIFDSGIGGLTVAKAITDLLPEESIHYFGDTVHLPYGDKSADTVRYYAQTIAQFLIDKGCKLIVIACNTASSVAFEILKKELEGRALLVNVIDPVVEGVASLNEANQIGVIGTKGTINSGAYAQKLNEKMPGIRVKSLATPLLAPMIEAGFFNNNISRNIIEAYLKDKDLNEIEALILACTHYPLIKQDIEQVYNGQVTVYDSTDFVAKEVRKLLNENGILNSGGEVEHRFYVSDYTESFEQTTSYFYKEKIKLEYFPLWDEQIQKLWAD